MTINKAIANAAELYPDSISDEIKARWLSELDGKISRETMHKNDFIPYEFPKDGDKSLLAAPPYDNIYELYIIAMSQFHNCELASYGATAAIFGRSFEEFRKNYIRNNMPPTFEIRL